MTDKAFKDRPIRAKPQAGYDCTKPGVSCFYNKDNFCVNCGNPKGWKQIRRAILREDPESIDAHDRIMRKQP